jgi:hypothetical protein
MWRKIKKKRREGQQSVQTYYFTSTKISRDARHFLVPWMSFPPAIAEADDAVKAINESWFGHARTQANVGTAHNSRQFHQARSYTKPSKKLPMGACKRYFLLEGSAPSKQFLLYPVRVIFLLKALKARARCRSEIETGVSAQSLSASVKRMCL